LKTQLIKSNSIQANFIFSQIIKNFAQYDFSEDEFLDDMENLFNHFEKLRLDKGTIYKVVRQCLYFDYDNVSIVAYKRFIELGILTTQQYEFGKSTIDEDFLKIHLSDQCCLLSLIF
jgi:hypothetical protein